MSNSPKVKAKSSKKQQRKKYRSREEIFDAMLQPLVTEQMQKAQLMYSAKLYINQYFKYFDMLVKMGLIKYDPETRYCRLTVKGGNYLVLRRKIHDLIGETS